MILCLRIEACWPSSAVSSLLTSDLFVPLVLADLSAEVRNTERTALAAEKHNIRFTMPYGLGETMAGQKKRKKMKAPTHARPQSLER